MGANTWCAGLVTRQQMIHGNRPLISKELKEPLKITRRQRQGSVSVSQAHLLLVVVLVPSLVLYIVGIETLEVVLQRSALVKLSEGGTSGKAEHVVDARQVIIQLVDDRNGAVERTQQGFGGTRAAQVGLDLTSNGSRINFYIGTRSARARANRD